VISLNTQNNHNFKRVEKNQKTKVISPITCSGGKEKEHFEKKGKVGGNGPAALAGGERSASIPRACGQCKMKKERILNFRAWKKKPKEPFERNYGKKLKFFSPRGFLPPRKTAKKGRKTSEKIIEGEGQSQSKDVYSKKKLIITKTRGKNRA